VSFFRHMGFAALMELVASWDLMESSINTLVVHRVTRECGDDRKLLLSGHGGKYKPVCSCKRVLRQD
jgi:hypothetical protein